MILPSEQLRRHVLRAVAKAYPQFAAASVAIEPTTDEKFGDYTTTVAMQLAPQLQQSAIDVAKNLIAQLGTIPMLERADVAGPGFINFTLRPAWLVKQAAAIVADKRFGQNASGLNRKIIVEFISANPTGPMTLGNGRGAFTGDTVANVLAMNGWRVTREFYLNDVGQQVNILAESVIRRYFQNHGIPTDYPDYCYQGEYVIELAKNLKLDRFKLQDMTTVRDRIKGRVLNFMIRGLERVVTKKLGVRFDSWFRESALHGRKLDETALDILRRHDLLYLKDGATWFRTTAFGDDKDRVLIKSDGEKTYFLSDIALRVNRFAQRGFEREILFLGADHHGYIRRLKAAMAALGQAGRLTVRIVQLVRLMKDGQEIKMSKRAGTYVTLEELVDEVSADVARFFFLMHGGDTHMDFDLTAAKERSEKNPVFYVQYAYARLSNILKKVGRQARQPWRGASQPSEARLVKVLLRFPSLVAEVGTSFETQRIPFYAKDLAAAFHDFYTNCRVIDEGKVWQHRLLLVQATRMVLQKTLQLMGISQPEKM